MALRVSSPKADAFPSESSDPEEVEISDEDDDDRNHKHRRREAQSFSLEGDATEQGFTRPYRKGKNFFDNGHVYRGSESQSCGTWKNYNVNATEKDLSSKFEKRRPGPTPFLRAPLGSNQSLRINQGDPGPVWGRGRDSGFSRYNPVDIASQIIQQGGVPPNLFAGRGMPTISNAHGTSWNAFGMVPRLPNGGMDALHPLGLTALNPSLNMGLPRQRCKDFEERGFCLRGDMCPMEHGVNRIVVEDVQSLSQFNLPVSLPANLPAASAGPGVLPATSGTTTSLSNSKSLHTKKSSKQGAVVRGMGLTGNFSDSSFASGTDVYDPDQPLWVTDCSKASTSVLNPSKVEEPNSSLGDRPLGDDHTGITEGSDNERVPVWGRITSSKNQSETREKVVRKSSSSTFIPVENEDREPSNGGADQGKLINNGITQCGTDSSMRNPSGNGRGARKPSQKAQRTLFVNGIPKQNNRRESLLSHFWKFGDIVDIHIPLNSERAFVQFSKREEAEAALMAPDAVMGNRFIKLWWANRDNIPDDGSTSNSFPVTPAGGTIRPVLPFPSAANKGKDDVQSVPGNERVPTSSPAPASDNHNSKPLVSSGVKATPPLQKKLENLEVLKEIRKKQEMLDLKRLEFRRQLDKLTKQATGLKGEITEQIAKRQKVVTEAATATSPRVEVTADTKNSTESVGSDIFKVKAAVALQEPSSTTKLSIHPSVPVGGLSFTNRFKLDNRSTAFKIIPPLPTGLANVAALKEHFSVYGDLSSVEVDDTEPDDGSNDSEMSKISACIYYATRPSAEKAFMGGKCWKGHNLQFMWLKSGKSSKDAPSGENSLPSDKGASNASVQTDTEVSSNDSERLASSCSREDNLERRDSGKEDSEPEK